MQRIIPKKERSFSRRKFLHQISSRKSRKEVNSAIGSEKKQRDHIVICWKRPSYLLIICLSLGGQDSSLRPTDSTATHITQRVTTKETLGLERVIFFCLCLRHTQTRAAFWMENWCVARIFRQRLCIFHKSWVLCWEDTLLFCVSRIYIWFLFCVCADSNFIPGVNRPWIRWKYVAIFCLAKGVAYIIIFQISSREACALILNERWTLFLIGGKLENWATEEFRAWKKNRRQWVKNEKSRAANS